jgi:hypothetical protein
VLLMKKNLLRTMARLPLDPQRSRADPLSTALAAGGCSAPGRCWYDGVASDDHVSQRDHLGEATP